MKKILVTETISQVGLERLRRYAQVDICKGLSHEQLRDIIGQYDAIIVRSGTKVTSDILSAGKRLRVVGRAGTGVDNIDVDAATKEGVAVVNAPTGNANAVAEQTIALMLALARRLYPAIASLKAGRWEKSSLQGIEVRGKTLGLIGLGRIGSLVASKAKALEMRVITFDPYASEERAASSGASLVSLEELLTTSDFVSIHTPLTPETRGMIGAEELAKLKPSAYIINCARGGIVDEQALKVTLEEKRIAGAALDVFVEEPAVDNELLESPRLIATPHLGGSTAEAQDSVAIDIAQAVIDVLEGGISATPVNMPYLPPKATEFLRPYMDLAQRLGSFFIQWHGRLPGKIELTYEGKVRQYDTRILTSAFLAGLLSPISTEPVNMVNALHAAEERGIAISEIRQGRREHFESVLRARFDVAGGEQSIAGTMLQDSPYLVSLDGQRLECLVQGHMLVDSHRDRPGIVGAMGQILGEKEINISFAQLSRTSRGGRSIMILGLDEKAPPDILSELAQIPNICRVRMVDLAPFDQTR
ncbi:MAG: phosphoglycerate dehydrogenase [Chloroflexota bacterium]|nr:phosphoglycerate dehydrogenase [Chloroflexota bacterium]